MGYITERLKMFPDENPMPRLPGFEQPKISRIVNDKNSYNYYVIEDGGDDEASVVDYFEKDTLEVRTCVGIEGRVYPIIYEVEALDRPIDNVRFIINAVSYAKAINQAKITSGQIAEIVGN
jgi:hypothetical protein